MPSAVDTWVALLRGVNVSGQRKLPMAELRGLCESIGFSGARTYLQSGNVVFSSDRPGASLAAILEAAIGAELGVETTVTVRSAGALDAVMRRNPFIQDPGDRRALYVTFLVAPPDAARREELLPPPGSGGDRFVLDGQEVFLSCPGGYGNTKLTNAFFERKLGLAATTRNWKTVGALTDMTAG